MEVLLPKTVSNTKHTNQHQVLCFVFTDALNLGVISEILHISRLLQCLTLHCLKKHCLMNSKLYFPYGHHLKTLWMDSKLRWIMYEAVFETSALYFRRLCIMQKIWQKIVFCRINSYEDKILIFFLTEFSSFVDLSLKQHWL